MRLCFALLCCLRLAAQDQIPLGEECTSDKAYQAAPPGGLPLLADPPEWRLGGPDAASAKLEQVPADGPGFETAWRITTTATTSAENRIVVTAVNAIPIAGGDALLLRFWARTLETQAADGRGRLRFSKQAAFAAPAFTGRPAEGWKLMVSTVPARLSFAAGQHTFTLAVGGTAPQTLEVGGFEFLNYRRTLQTHQLPYACATYEGRAPEAAWRARAEADIEKYRKANLAVQVVDSSGAPVAGVPVRVKMLAHDFEWGTAAGEPRINGASNPDNDRYRESLLAMFNHATLDNALKWPNWEAAGGRQRALGAVDWLISRGLSVRGHAVHWPSWTNSPARIRTEYESKLASLGSAEAGRWLREQCEARVRDAVSALRGRIHEWDLVNEPVGNRDFMRILGDSVMDDWFRIARETDPEALFFINENGVEQDGNAKTQSFFEIVRDLLARGAPVGGVGIQAHVGAISIPSYLRALDRFASLGLPIKITEFDMVTPDERLQAEFTRDFLTATFSHHAVKGFLMWGFWDNNHWLHDAPLYYRDWTLKPSGQVWSDLIYRQWWTDEERLSDAGGAVAVRGFLGRYEVSAGGVAVPVLLKHGGAEVRLVVGGPAN